MNRFKYIFISCIFLYALSLQAKLYISDIVNNTTSEVQVIYISSHPTAIIMSKSIITGNHESSSVNVQQMRNILTLPPMSITSVNNTDIPLTSKNVIEIKIAQQIRLLPSNKKSTRASEYSLDKSIPYILEIDGLDKLKLSIKTNEKIESYIKPQKISPQELLHQAIVNDSVADIDKAIQLGANINKGIADQSPLLMAILLGRTKAIQKLLQYDINPNISYQQKHVIWSLIRSWNMSLALSLFNKGATITDAEKTEFINYIMFNSPHTLNTDAILVLKKCGYDIKTNFNSTDLEKNKWYKLLVKQGTGTKNGKIIGHRGLPSLEIVQLFLKYGANQNQLFVTQDGTTWTPILLLLENYFFAPDKTEYMSLITKLLEALLAAGANIDQTAETTKGHKESPLSYALKYDESGFIIDFLVKQKASVDAAIILFLANGGSPSKKLLSPLKHGAFDLLWWAVENNNPKAVQLLLNAGLKHTTSSLNLAITKGYSDIIKLLMNN